MKYLLILVAVLMTGCASTSSNDCTPKGGLAGILAADENVWRDCLNKRYGYSAPDANGKRTQTAAGREVMLEDRARDHARRKETVTIYETDSMGNIRYNKPVLVIEK